MDKVMAIRAEPRPAKARAVRPVDTTSEPVGGSGWFAKSNSAGEVIVWALVTLLICLHFCLTYVSSPSFLDPVLYTSGQSATPYQYRVLPMYLFRALMPTHAVAAVAAHLPKALNSPYEVVLFFLTFFAIFGAVLATSATISRLTGDGIFGRWMSLLVVYMAYFNLAPRWGLSYTLPYDVPSLFFFCMGLYLILSRRWLAFYILFPLAVLDRETACFLTVFFVVWEWMREGSESVSGKVIRLVPHVIAQAALWVGIKIYLSHLFAANPAEGGARGGSIFYGQLLYNLHELVKPQQWPVFLSVCGFLLPALWAGRRWIRCAGLAWGTSIVMGLWFLGMMKVGVITELRIFSEWTAFAVPTLALIVYHRFRPVDGREAVVAVAE